MQDQIEKIDLQLVRLFLDIAAASSYVRAAKARQEKRSTLTKRIARLEEHLGLKLFTRHGFNVKLTPDGEVLKSAAIQFMQAGHALAATVRHIQNAVTADIWLDVPEGLAAFWVIPSLIDFRVSNPTIFLRFDHRMQRTADYLDRFDFLIDFTSLEHPGFNRSVVAYLHLIPFASHGYIARFGVPKSEAEWKNHLFVAQNAPHIAGDEIREVLGVEVDQQPRTITTPSGTAHFHAVQRAGGIGLLPTYLAATAENLSPMPFRKPYRVPVVLHYRAEALGRPGYRPVFDALVAMFDPTRYPWFSSEFVSPSSFAPLPPNDALLIRSLRLAPPFSAPGDAGTPVVDIKNKVCT